MDLQRQSGLHRSSSQVQHEASTPEEREKESGTRPGRVSRVDLFARSLTHYFPFSELLLLLLRPKINRQLFNCLEIAKRLKRKRKRESRRLSNQLDPYFVFRFLKATQTHFQLVSSARSRHLYFFFSSFIFHGGLKAAFSLSLSLDNNDDGRELS